MEEKELNDNFMMLSDDLKKYVRAHMDLTRITLFEKSSKMSVYLITRVIIILLAFFALWAGVMAFVYWYHKVYGSFIEPFLISAVGFVVFIGLVLLLRKPLISKQIVKNFSRLFLNDDDFDEIKNLEQKKKQQL